MDNFDLMVISKKFFSYDVDKSLAAKILETTQQNRNISKRNLDSIKRDIENGSFLENGDTIKLLMFNNKYCLIDGQHRIKAFLSSSLERIKLNFFITTDVNVFQTIDIGKKRSHGEVLFIKGHKNATLLAAGISLYLKYKKNPEAKYTLDITVTPTEIIEELSKNENIWEKCAEIGSGLRNVFPPSSTTAAAFMAFQENDSDFVLSFFEKTKSCVLLEENDPCLVLKKWAEKKRDTLKAKKSKQYSYDCYRAILFALKQKKEKKEIKKIQLT